MSLSAANHLRTLAFGDVQGGFWGAALHAAHPVLVFGDSSGATWSAALSSEGWNAEGVGWRLTGEGVDLHVAPGGEASPVVVDGVEFHLTIRSGRSHRPGGSCGLRREFA